jgi:2-polyprenyl-6-methoxyphenol hydroxylase-like FAD-dependent oxidoreductase
MTILHTQCCIAGGGPAGVMLGYLLARAGVDVIVLEKHADFLRDFRGDTIHPSTLEMLYDLGLLDEFLKLPHQNMPHVDMVIDGQRVEIADFSHLSVHCKYIAFMPQWDFLNFMAAQGKKYPGFHLYQNAEVTGLITTGDKVTGLKVKAPTEDWQVHADLVIGADGRSSTVRRQAGLEVQEFGVPIDVLWLHIPKTQDMTEIALGYFTGDKMMILIDRDEYFQCGYIIPKGKFDDMKARGLEAFRADMISLAPFLAPFVSAITDWSEVQLLTVQINRLKTWYREGLLCIGDAAHAMSPAGGVGINLAIQDAVATANILADALRQNRVTTQLLAQVQQRREMPARRIQSLQVFVHNQIINPMNAQRTARRIMIPMLLFKYLPILRRIPAYYIGMGFRPEHVNT